MMEFNSIVLSNFSSHIPKPIKRRVKKNVSRDFETSLKERPTKINQINTSIS
jgi:hypothetical protein